MPEETRTPEDEALIRHLVRTYELRLRQALTQRPQTLEQSEDTAEQIGNQSKRDIQQRMIEEEGTGNVAGYLPRTPPAQGYRPKLSN